MSIEESTIKSPEIKPVKAEQEVSIEAEKSPEEIENEMSKKAGSEVADFNQSGEDELEHAEEKITKSGLQINTKKEASELAELNQEAKQAKNELQEEISEFEIISEKEIEDIKKLGKTLSDLEDNGKFFEKNELCKKFLESNLGKKGYFSTLLKNSETSNFTLEAMRNFLVPDRPNDCLREKDKKTQGLLLPEVLSSLDNIEDQLRNNDAERNDNGSENNLRLNNRFKNNAFYVVSEMLDRSNSPDQKMICEWLAKHFSDIIDPKLSQADSRKNSDIISHFSLSNIAGYSSDRKLIVDSLENLLDKSEMLNGVLSDIFLDKSDDGRKEVVADFFADKLGLGKKIISKWKESKMSSGKKDENGKEIFIESYMSNILSAIVLEEMKPGSAKSLFEKFGIANFSRYHEDDLIHQLEVEDQSKPYGVVAFPEADWNGAFNSFNIKKNLNRTANKLQEKGLEMRIIEASSQFELARRLYGFDKKYGQNGDKISFMIIAGHGTPDSVQLGNFKAEQEPPPIKNPEMTDADYIKSDAFKTWQIGQKDSLRKSIIAKDIEGDSGKGLRRAANNWFEEKAPVVFLSCSTGKEGGIAQSASDNLGFETVGPEKDTAIELIDVDFNEQGKPVFDVKYSSNSGDVKAMRYKKEAI